MKRKKCTCAWGDAQYGGRIRTSSCSSCPQHGAESCTCKWYAHGRAGDGTCPVHNPATVIARNPTKVEGRLSWEHKLALLNIPLWAGVFITNLNVFGGMFLVVAALIGCLIVLGQGIARWATAGMIDRAEAERKLTTLSEDVLDARLRALDDCKPSWEDPSHPIYKERLNEQRELEALAAPDDHDRFAYKSDPLVDRLARQNDLVRKCWRDYRSIHQKIDACTYKPRRDNLLKKLKEVNDRLVDAAEEQRILLQQVEMQAKFRENGAQPSMVLTQGMESRPLTKAEVKAIRDEFKQRHFSDNVGL
jgi:hypothetical protein